MTAPRTAGLFRRAARLLDRPQAADAALLARVASDGDPAAFAELLARHGPGVWSVCRRAVRSEADAEDVFRATFLVLARDAGRVRRAASVGSWLFGVAYRLGRKARARLARTPDASRLVRTPAADPAAEVSWAEVRAALDEELARLPDRLRAPLLLCYYHGQTQDEAAAELGWTARAVKARVARGRTVLRARLTRRGVELPAALAVPLLTATTAPARLTAALTTAAINVARRRPPGDGVSRVAVALAHYGGPVVTSFRAAVGLACAAALASAGVVFALRDDAAPQAAAAQPAAAQPAPPTEPLPPGAVALIGTGQFRQVGWHHRAFFTADPDVVVVKAERGIIRFWHVPTGVKVAEITLPDARAFDAHATPDGRLLAVAGWHQVSEENGKSQPAVWLIDTSTRKVLRRIDLTDIDRDDRGRVRLSADGKRVFCVLEGSIRVWDARTGDELLRHKANSWADAFTVSQDGRRVVYGQHDLFAWEWESGAEPRKLLSARTEGAWFAPDNRTVYAERGGRLAVVDTVAGRQTGLLDIPVSYACAVSPDGKTLAVGPHWSATTRPDGQAVCLVDAATGLVTRRLPVGRGGVTHLSWSADGTRVAGVDDYRVMAWDAATGRVLGPTRPGHEAHVTGLAFTPDGTLVSASDDHTVRTWDTAGNPVRVMQADGWVRGLAVSSDGALAAGSALRNDLRVWEVKTGRERFKLLGNGSSGGTRMVRFSTDGKRLVAWGDDEFLRVWDTRNGRLLAEHTTRPADAKHDPDDPFADRLRFHSIGHADASPDGRVLALTEGKGVRLIDTMSGETTKTLDVTSVGWPERVEYAPDGKRLVVASRLPPTETRLSDGRLRSSGSKEYTLSLWDAGDGKKLWVATVPGWKPADLAFSPDGAKLAATAYGDPLHTIRLLDAATGADAGRVPLLQAGGPIAFDRTGRRLAVGLNDTTAVVFDLATALTPPGGKP